MRLIMIVSAAALVATPALAFPSFHKKTTTNTTAPAATSTTTTTSTTASSKTRGPAKPRTAASLACSQKADAANSHGKAREKFMRDCKKSAGQG